MSTTKQEQEALPLKIKKPSLKRSNDEVFKVTINKDGDAIQERKTEEVPVGESSGDSKEMGEGVSVTNDAATETPQENPIKEIKEEKVIAEEPKVETTPKITMPENIQKAVDFMNETGGTLDDYVRLNTDYSALDGDFVLRQYYQQTKPHLDHDEIDFILQDQFSYDEETDDERDVRKKKLAVKEEVAKARQHFEDLKNKYYEEIKLRPSYSEDQQKAIDFFNRYNKEQEDAKLRHNKFIETTNNYLTSDFEGFEFNVGEKKFSYNVNNPSNVANQQSNISTFLKKFLNNSGEIEDYKGYHKALYTASNADTIANHFYEQGKADAVKDMMAKSKNISTEPRTQPSDGVFINGLKVTAINGVDSSKLRIKKKKHN